MSSRGIKRRTCLAAVGLAAIAAVALPVQAGATPVDPLDGFSLVSNQRGWDSYDTGSGCEVSAYTPAYYGLSYAGNRYSYAFQSGAHMLNVDGIDWSPDDNVGDYNKKSKTLKVGPADVGDLNITRYEHADGSWLRSLIKVKNTSDMSISGESVLWDNRLNATDTHLTSDGDGDYEGNDRWLSITSSSEYYGPVALALYGKGSPQATPADPLNTPDADSCVTVELSIDVPANATRYLMFFADMQPTVAKQNKAAKKWDDKGLSNQLLSGISNSVQSKILNWDL